MPLQEGEVKKLAEQLQSNTAELGRARKDLQKVQSQLQAVEKERDEMAGKLTVWEEHTETLKGIALHSQGQTLHTFAKVRRKCFTDVVCYQSLTIGWACVYMNMM